MVRNYKRKSLPKYPQSDMKKAMDTVRNKNLQSSNAASQFNVPLSSLYARLSGKRGSVHRDGQNVLSVEEEVFLVHTVETFENGNYHYYDNGLLTSHDHICLNLANVSIQLLILMIGFIAS